MLPIIIQMVYSLEIFKCSQFLENSEKYEKTPMLFAFLLHEMDINIFFYFSPKWIELCYFNYCKNVSAIKNT